MFEENEISKNANGGTEIAKRRLQEALDPELLKHFQIVCSRVREIDESKIRIFWSHDLPQDPECAWLRDSQKRDRFHQLVWISHWQYQQFRDYLGVPYDGRNIVIESGITPVAAVEKDPDVCNLYYASTPNRGLEILIPAFAEVAKQLQQPMKLHVHSSFKIYGWEEQDKLFEPLYEQCRAHPQIEYHGYTPHAELLEKVKGYDGLAYPCIWPETSCRTMLEAMSAGCFVVHPNFAALPDTSGGMNFMYQGSTDKNEHVQIFANALYRALQIAHDEENRGHFQRRIMFNKSYIDTRFSFDAVLSRWEQMLRGLLARYPTEDSRKLPQEMFFLRTGP